ncbi:MAG: type II methionyl aminopeptidase [Candidatus Aenigmarchaeota archaeon]|nr:type II methionyl aminopeptidase [Candidatus Aenigmarchaeota archaeon]
MEYGDYIEAGKIAAKAVAAAKKVLGEGVGYIEVCDTAEGVIRSAGAGFAFPTNVSVNEVAAHDTAAFGDKRVLKCGDVVKVDIGAHVNGCIADTAFTVEIGSDEHGELIKASREALENVIKIMRPGVRVAELGGVIERTIKAKGFNPIVNLSGHVVEPYVLHSGIIVPNYDNSSDVVLEEGVVVAIEPFATTGVGRVVQSKDSRIYRLNRLKPTRLNRDVLEKVKKYEGLPFASRWLGSADLALKRLSRLGILENYNILREESNGIVSQAEHTIIVLDKPIVTTI